MRGRNRMIKPAFFQHGDLFDVEVAFKAPARLAYEGLWCWTDRERRFEWNPAMLKLNILPYDPCWRSCGQSRCSCTMERALEALLAGGFIYRYQVAGRSYGFLPTLTKHQSINRNEAASDIPAPTAEQMREIERDIEQRALSGGFHMYRDESMGMHMHSDSSLNSLESRDGHMQAYGKGKEGKEIERDEDQDHAEQQAAPLGYERQSLSFDQHNPDAPQFPDLSEVPFSAPDMSFPEIESRAVTSEESIRGELMLPERTKIAKRTQPLPAIKGAATAEKIQARLAQVSAEIAEGRRSALSKAQQRELLAEIVFTYWILKHGHKRALFDRKRAARIESRLEENEDDLSELFYALDGALKDKAIQGYMHDDGQRYDGIETIFRDRAQVERLARQIPAYRKEIPHPDVEKYREAFNLNPNTTHDEETA